VEGLWIWSTSQTKIVAHNWEPSEPNNVGYGEDCLVVNHDGKWNDFPCNITTPYICEAEFVAIFYPLIVDNVMIHHHHIRSVDKLFIETIKSFLTKYCRNNV
jgi:hypothetical protein